MESHSPPTDIKSFGPPCWWHYNALICEAGPMTIPSVGIPCFDDSALAQFIGQNNVLTSSLRLSLSSAGPAWGGRGQGGATLTPCHSKLSHWLSNSMITRRWPWRQRGNQPAPAQHLESWLPDILRHMIWRHVSSHDYPESRFQTRHMTCCLIWRVWVFKCRYRTCILSCDVIWSQNVFLNSWLGIYSIYWYIVVQKLICLDCLWRYISRRMTVYYISVKICQSTYQYILVHTGTYWYIWVHTCSPVLFPAAPGWPSWKLRTCFCQTTPGSSCNKFILSRLFLAFAGGGSRLSRVARKLDGDVPWSGTTDFAFESRARAPSILRMPSYSKGAVMNLWRSRMRCGDVDATTKIWYMIFQSFCVQKISNYWSTWQCQMKTIHLSLRKPLRWRFNEISFISTWSNRQSLSSVVIKEPERSNEKKNRWENKLNYNRVVVYSHFPMSHWRVCVD